MGGPFFIPRDFSGRWQREALTEGFFALGPGPLHRTSCGPLPRKSWGGYGGAVLYLVIKAALSGILVAAVSEIAHRYPGWGGLVASLPLTSLLAMLWLWRDTGDSGPIAELAGSTFWFILPSLPLFIALPLLLRSGIGFWLSMAIVVAGTLALYATMFWAAPKLGVKL